MKDHIENILSKATGAPSDRPAVKQGERYLYIDTRLIKAPYGVISIHEVKAACRAKLSAASWAVYMYLLCITSGRGHLKPTELGGRQLTNGTGLSKASVYRALKELEKAELIKPSARTKNRRAWLLVNPSEDAIRETATEEALENADKEREVKEQVNKDNRAVSNLLTSGVDSLKSETRNTKNSLKSDTNSSTESNSMYLLGGEPHQGKQVKVEEYRLIQPYLEHYWNAQHIEMQKYLIDRGQEEADTIRLAWSHATETGDHELAGHLARELDKLTNSLEARARQQLAELWLATPHDIAFALTNRLQSKTCELRRMGWSGTQSSKKITRYVHRFASEQNRPLNG